MNLFQGDGDGEVWPYRVERSLRRADTHNPPRSLFRGSSDDHHRILEVESVHHGSRGILDVEMVVELREEGDFNARYLHMEPQQSGL